MFINVLIHPKMWDLIGFKALTTLTIFNPSPYNIIVPVFKVPYPLVISYIAVEFIFFTYPHPAFNDQTAGQIHPLV